MLYFCRCIEQLVPRLSTPFQKFANVCPRARNTSTTVKEALSTNRGQSGHWLPKTGTFKQAGRARSTSAPLRRSHLRLTKGRILTRDIRAACQVEPHLLCYKIVRVIKLPGIGPTIGVSGFVLVRIAKALKGMPHSARQPDQRFPPAFCTPLRRVNRTRRRFRCGGYDPYH